MKVLFLGDKKSVRRNTFTSYESSTCSMLPNVLVLALAEISSSYNDLANGPSDSATIALLI